MQKPSQNRSSKVIKLFIFIDSSRNGSPSKTLSLKLVGNIRKELANDEDEIFYSDKLKKALKKLK